MARKSDDSARQLREFIAQAQEELNNLQEHGKEKLGKVREDYGDQLQSIDDFIRDNPYLAIGGALLLGYFVGRITKRRRK